MSDLTPDGDVDPLGFDECDECECGCLFEECTCVDDGSCGECSTQCAYFADEEPDDE